MRPYVVAALLPLAVAACGDLANHSGERSLNRREIAPGPGLLTGPAGTWIILSRDLPSPNKGDTAGAPSSERTTTP
jgi:hypothetical protein